jgi:hypothetical protein
LIFEKIRRVCSLKRVTHHFQGFIAFPVLVKYSYYPTPYPLSASGEGNFGASLLGGWGSSDVPHLSENRFIALRRSLRTHPTILKFFHKSNRNPIIPNRRNCHLVRCNCLFISSLATRGSRITRCNYTGLKLRTATKI